eukprot:1049814-Rhodomonas_salina.1
MQWAAGRVLLLVLAVTGWGSSDKFSSSEAGVCAACVLPTSASFFVRKGPCQYRASHSSAFQVPWSSSSESGVCIRPLGVLRLRGYGSSEDNEVYSAEEEEGESANEGDRIESADLEADSGEREEDASSGHMSDSSDAFNEKKLSQYARRGELSDAEVQVKSAVKQPIPGTRSISVPR